MMREFTKSMGSLMLALSLFGLKQMQNIVTPRERGARRGPGAKAFDSVTHATTDQFGETLRATFRVMDNVQRSVIGLTFGMFLPFLGSTSGREAKREQGGREGWSSGDPRRVADVTLSGPQRNVEDALADAAPASPVGRRV
jgi:hypothetical protein